MTKPCILNGVKYASQTDAAKALGVTKQAISARVKRGVSERPPGRPGTPIVLGGVEFSSVSEAAETIGVRENYLYGYRYTQNAVAKWLASREAAE